MLAKSINVSKLKFSAPKTLSNQSRTVYINYEGDKLRVQTPVMFLPYGVGDNEKINANNPVKKDEAQAKRYDINVSFRGMESNPKLQMLHDKMQEIEKRIIDEAFENRQTWLRDDYDGVKAFVAKLCTPIIKYDKNRETGKIENRYPPTMKLKLPYDDKTDAFNFECDDMDGNELDFKGVMTKLKGAKAQLIIQLGGIWFAGGRYGCTWRVVRAKFEVTNIAKIGFIEDSDDEGTDDKKVMDDEDSDVEEDALANVSEVTPPKELVSALTDKLNATAVSESEPSDEEEDDESDEEEPAPPPPPPPVKARKTTKAK